MQRSVHPVQSVPCLLARNILSFNLDSINFSVHRTVPRAPSVVGEANLSHSRFTWWNCVSARNGEHSHEFNAFIFFAMCLFSRMGKSVVAHKYDEKKKTEEMKSFHELAVFVVGRSKRSIWHLLCLWRMQKKKTMESLSDLRRSRSFTYLLIKAEVKKSNVLDIRSNGIIAAPTIDSVVSLDAPQTR